MVSVRDDSLETHSVRLQAEEMNNLSATEREKILDDVHCISGVDGLSDETILQKIDSLKKALEGMRSFSTVFDLALRTNADYVMDPEFQTMFLRASEWNPAKAATRLVQFLEEKHRLFCQDKPDLLCRDITQDDLDSETLQMLYGDWLVELLVGDMAGRPIDVIQPANATHFSTQCKLKRLLYGTVKRARSSVRAKQKENRILVIWIDSPKSPDPAATWGMGKLMPGVPMQYDAVHICFMEKGFAFLRERILSLIFRTVSTFMKLRIRVHLGSPDELREKLKDFGIPPILFQTDDKGCLILPNRENCKWRKYREEEREEQKRKGMLLGASVNRPRFQSNKRFEDSRIPISIPIPETTMDASQIPLDQDVLLGRGRANQMHAGNRQLFRLIEETKETYDAASKPRKTVIAEDIVMMVKSWKGRFLKETKYGWEEVEDLVARKKVANCFRTMRVREKKAGESHQS